MRYVEFKGFFNRVHYGTMHILFSAAEKYFPEDKIEVFFYREKPESETKVLYVFSNTDIWIFSIELGVAGLKVQVKHDYKVNNLELLSDQNDRYFNTKLLITFSDGENMEFSAVNPIEDWIEVQTGWIKNIFELISKAP